MENAELRSQRTLIESVVKLKPKESQRPIRAKKKITTSQYELNVKTSTLLEARENARDQIEIGGGLYLFGSKSGLRLAD